MGVSEYMASVLLGVLSKDSGGVESEMTLSLLSILFRGFHCYETVLISPPNHLSSCHSFLLWSRSPIFIIKSCSFSAAQAHVAVTDTSAHCLQEVTALVRDAVDQRVKQYTELLHNRRQPKQKRELAPASALFVKGNQW